MILQRTIRGLINSGIDNLSFLVEGGSVMFCPSCGKEIPEGATFCPNCGATVRKASSPNGQVAFSGVINKSKMNIFGIIASVVLLLSAFLPFVSVNIFGSSLSASLMDGGDGIIVIAFAIAGIVFSLLGIDIVVIITGVAGIIIFFVENSQFSEVASDDEFGALASAMIDKGPGFYFLLLGSICLIIAGIIRFIQKKKS